LCIILGQRRSAASEPGGLYSQLLYPRHSAIIARVTRPLRLLPPGLIDRIAAGEVIERPAAALKELVENALDAGATRIEVAIEGGGIDRIEVNDDGCGMTAAELALAVQRHATSKLDPEDTDGSALVRIQTLGFRGEALPSIGAAARLTLTSRTQTAEHASRITVAGSIAGPAEPAAGARGTTVSVTDLFYATPARRKFLKSARSETDAAEAALRRLAFAAPAVGFRLTIDGREAFDLPPQDRDARIAALLGPAALGGLLPLDHTRGDLHLAGLIGTPGLTRATGAGQSLVVNGRPVSDPVLRTAVRIAYRNVIESGRHPVVALYLTLPPEAVDVNVHPAKTELRFASPDAVRALVIGGLQRALAAPAGNAAPVVTPFFQSARNPARAYATPPPSGFAEPRLAFAAAPAARLLPQAEPTPDHPLGAPLAQIMDTYILSLAEDGCLVLVDQHAAHERLTHEALRDQLSQGSVRSQALLLPVVVDLSRAEATALLTHAPTLERLGLELEAFGPGAVLLRAIPAVLLGGRNPPDAAALLHDLAEEFVESDAATALDSLLDAAIARLACHGSIRAGRRLAPAEMDALLRQMEATPRAATCSHGRPTFLKLSRSELERLFGRR
jgi:DNA mismatch repair protein MutL